MDEYKVKCVVSEYDPRDIIIQVVRVTDTYDHRIKDYIVCKTRHVWSWKKLSYITLVTTDDEFERLVKEKVCEYKKLAAEYNKTAELAKVICNCE